MFIHSSKRITQNAPLLFNFKTSYQLKPKRPTLVNFRSYALKETIPSVDNTSSKYSFKYYYQHFKSQPGKNLISFLILHELTAILPIIILVSSFQAIDLKLMSEETLKNYISKLEPYIDLNQYLEKASKFSRYVMKNYFNVTEEKDLSSESNLFFNLLLSYALVKLLAPVRIMVSAALAPGFSNKVITPLSNKVSKIFK